MFKCLDKDFTVKPTYTVGSSPQKLGLLSSCKDCNDLDEDEDDTDKPEEDIKCHTIKRRN